MLPCTEIKLKSRVRLRSGRESSMNLRETMLISTITMIKTRHFGMANSSSWSNREILPRKILRTPRRNSTTPSKPFRSSTKTPSRNQRPNTKWSLATWNKSSTLESRNCKSKPLNTPMSSNRRTSN